MLEPLGWIYEYIPAMRPDTDDAPVHVFPRVCRWTRCTISQPANGVSDIRKAFSHLRVSDVNWEPYKDMDPAFIPNMCVAPDNVCSSRTWLISFNVREVYVPDRFARQFGQEQHQLSDAGGLQRHHWNASVDWSLEYASEIKHFEQLTNAARHDHTTLPATSNTTKCVFTAPCTAEFHDLNLPTVVENIKEELPTIIRFLERQSLPVEVARSFARIREVLEASHMKEGNVAVDAQGGGTSRPELTAPHPPAIPEDEENARIRELPKASHMDEGNVDARGGGTSRPELTALHPPAIPACEQAATGTTDGPATAEAPEPVSDEAMQNSSDQPAPECCDTPREEVGAVSGTPVEEALELSESSEEDEEERGQKGWKRRGGGLRRSNRRCVQAKRFRHRGGKGSVASDPIVL